MSRSKTFAATSAPFLEAVERAERALREESSTGGGWWSPEEDSDDTDMLVAYFSTEFGVDESLPIYSGGLGVLAGDHLKASSELGLPLVWGGDWKMRDGPHFELPRKAYPAT